MSTFAMQENTTDRSPLLDNSPNAGLLLQRKFALGVPELSMTSEFEGRPRLQTKLTMGASNDPLEQEADRIADQVLAAPTHSAVSGAVPRHEIRHRECGVEDHGGQLGDCPIEPVQRRELQHVGGQQIT